MCFSFSKKVPLKTIFWNIVQEKTQWVKEDRRRNKPRAVVQPYEGGYSQQVRFFSVFRKNFVMKGFLSISIKNSFK